MCIRDSSVCVLGLHVLVYLRLWDIFENFAQGIFSRADTTEVPVRNSAPLTSRGASFHQVSCFSACFMNCFIFFYFFIFFFL